MAYPLEMPSEKISSILRTCCSSKLVEKKGNAMKSWRVIIAAILIACALGLMLYKQTLLLAPVFVDNYVAFLSYTLKLPFPTVKNEYVGVIDLGKAWKPRILSLYLGDLVTRKSVIDENINNRRFAHYVGLWTALWFGAIALLYILCFKGQSFLFIMATYCGLAFGYMPGIVDRIFPWDLPALFFFVLFLVLLDKNKIIYFLPLFPIAVLFKETCIILAIAYLFINTAFKKKLWLFAAALLLALLPKFLANILTGAAGWGFINIHLLWSNIKFIAGNMMPFFINAGLLWAFIVIPFKSRNSAAIKCIFWLFVIAVLTNAVVFEYRIWFELIPLCVYALWHHMSRDKQAAVDPQVFAA
jgi:hypothetical protein